jgi:hypothetical protein
VGNAAVAVLREPLGVLAVLAPASVLCKQLSGLATVYLTIKPMDGWQPCLYYVYAMQAAV